MSDEPLLQVRNLEKHYEQKRGLKDIILRNEEDPVQAVDGVSFSVGQNETIGVIGESGCGKTTLLEVLMGLEPMTGGDILYRGQRMSEFDKDDWLRYRRNVQIIFQDPFDSLDPKQRVRTILLEPLRIHGIDNKNERIHDILEQVNLGPAEQYLPLYPSQLSGGEKQRVAVARALILEPEIILADEPVSMLDVSTQAAVLRLLSHLTDEMGVSMVYISHDLSTVSYVCDSVSVMYLGRLVERAPTIELIDDPKHPYTQALVNSIPIPDPYHERETIELQGSPREPIGLGEGCRFRDRCPDRMDICDRTPMDVELGDGRQTACHLYYDHEDTQERMTEREHSEAGYSATAGDDA